VAYSLYSTSTLALFKASAAPTLFPLNPYSGLEKASYYRLGIRLAELLPLILIPVLYLSQLPSPNYSTLKMEVARTSESLVSYNITDRDFN
jgi:hypothetical protein